MASASPRTHALTSSRRAELGSRRAAARTYLRDGRVGHTSQRDRANIQTYELQTVGGGASAMGGGANASASAARGPRPRLTQHELCVPRLAG